MRCGRSVPWLVLAGVLIFGCHRAQASAIALSDITANNLQITPASGSIVFDVFTTQAFAQAQNSLGDLDPQFDIQFGAPSLADALVTWADGHAASGDSEWIASSNVNLLGDDPRSASSHNSMCWWH